MPLSEDERRQLQQIELDLLAEDPRLATSLSRRRWQRASRPLIAASGVVLGLVLMAIGLRLKGPLGIVIADAGFLLLVISTYTLGSYLGPRLRRPRRSSAKRPKQDDGGH